MVEGMRRGELDSRAQSALMQIGRSCLVDRDALKEVGVEYVEVERAAHIVAGVGDRLHAIDLGGGEKWRQAAHRDLLAFPARPAEGHAGNALDRLRKVGIWKLSDIFGQDGVGGSHSLPFVF